MKETGNSEEEEVDNPNTPIAKPWLFQPGQSGNPSGRPPNSMKDYLKRKFSKMNDQEKEDWLQMNEVSGETQFKMAEGNPHSTSDIEVTLPPLPIDDVTK